MSDDEITDPDLTLNLLR